MPDVVSDVHSLTLRHIEDFMDDDTHVHGVDPMLSSHHLLNSLHSPSAASDSLSHDNNHNINLGNNIESNRHFRTNHHHHQHHHHHHNVQHSSNDLDLHHTDPLLSSNHTNVDISHCISPLLSNSMLHSPTQKNHDTLQSDNDSLVNDIDLDT